MIMSQAHMTVARKRPTIVISSALLDTLMSSSNVVHGVKTSAIDGSVSSSVSSTQVKKKYDDKKSALRFTPSQLHKVHKRRKEGSHKNSLKRTSCNIPIVGTFETDGPMAKHGESPSRSGSGTCDRDGGLGSSRPKDFNSSLETYRSRDEHTHSPVRISFSSETSLISSRKSSLSAFGSCSSKWKSEHDSDIDSEEIHNSSVYLTPEGTPLPLKSKEVEKGQNSRFKRSLSDEQNDWNYSANSSLNNSGYYTPEGSPSKFNCAKRLKTRWSDSSSFSLDNSSFLSWRNRTSDSSDKGVQPELIGYQMVGDSQFCRFGQQLLGLERVPMPNSSGRIGICVSGQTITDLHKRVRDNFYPISDKIILMIGTNDFLRNVDVMTMCNELTALVKTLQKSASNIILLTLPPIPKLEKRGSGTHFKLLNVYNSHIRSLENGKTLRIADISPLYMTSTPYQKCRMHLFEVYFNGPAKRLDLIHLNRSGLEIIRKYILDKFL